MIRPLTRMEPEKPSRFPHPSVIAIRDALKKRPRPNLERIEEQILAARAALAKQPPASLESVRRQAKASEEWRKRQSEGKDGP